MMKILPLKYDVCETYLLYWHQITLTHTVQGGSHKVKHMREMKVLRKETERANERLERETEQRTEVGEEG